MPTTSTIPGEQMRGELRKRIERCRKFGDMTRNGIVFDWELPVPLGPRLNCFGSRTTPPTTSPKPSPNYARTEMSFLLSVTNVSASELSAEIPPEPDESRIIQEAESRPFHTILRTISLNSASTFSIRCGAQRKEPFRTCNRRMPGSAWFSSSRSLADGEPRTARREDSRP